MTPIPRSGLVQCSFHHHLVHEGGWGISTSADGAFLFQSLRGKPLEQNPPPEPVEDIVEWMRRWADEGNLDLGPDVNIWDGTKPDYDLAVSCLLEAGAPGATLRDELCMMDP